MQIFFSCCLFPRFLFFISKLCKALCNILRYLLKDDLQSVLRTLESLFTTSVLFHVRRHKI